MESFMFVPGKRGVLEYGGDGYYSNSDLSSMPLVEYYHPYSCFPTRINLGGKEPLIN